MAKNYRTHFFAILFLGFISLQCNNNRSGGQQDHLTGLIFASKDELAGIPLASSPYGAGELPSSKDLSADLPPVGNQGRQNSCVGWAAAYALKSFQEKIETRSDMRFSPAFIYNQINNGQDGGSRFIDALNLLSQQGAAKLDDMPYNESDFRTQPTQTAKENAKPFRIDYWRQVNVMDIKEVKAQLNAGYPVVIGAALDQGFKAGRSNDGAEYIWKAVAGNTLGGHAMLVVGYDDSRNAFKVMNSWGTNWGNNGFCWIDYSFFPRAVKEGYVAKDAVTPVTQTTTTTTTTTDPNIVIPNYNPTEFKKVRFENIQVTHNQTHATYGNCMRITGVADIPKGTGKTFQISTHFYYSNTTTQIGSLQSPLFADVNGYAAAGTILYKIPEEGLNNWAFEIYMPYTAFNTPVGSYVNGQYQTARTALYAIPTLFIDNFGYAKGDAISFYVDK